MTVSLSEAEICTLYLSGVGTPEIERRIGRSQTYVDAVLKRAGVEKRKAGRLPFRPRPERRVPIALREEALALYRVGESARSISQKLRIGKSVVLKEVREAGDEVRTQRLDNDDEVVGLYTNGVSAREIARRLGTNHKLVARRLRQHAIERRPQRSKEHDQDIVAAYEAGETAAHIGRRIGCAKAFVFAVLRRNEIQVRRKNRRLSADGKRDLVSRYIAGETTLSLCSRYGVCTTTVLNAVREGAVDVRIRVERCDYHSPIAGDIRPCGTWELAYAKILDAWWLGGAIASWSYEPDRIALPSGNVYIPDFKVVSLDGSAAYHEIKGRLWEKGARKIKEARAMGHAIVLLRRRLLGPLTHQYGVEVVL